MNDAPRSTAAPVPGFCCFGITDSCMLRCRMCQKWKDDIFVAPGTPEISIAEWKEFATRLRRIVPSGFEIDIGGGEALLKLGLPDLVAHCHELGFTTTIASNGWLAGQDPRWARALAQAGLDKFILSLDSLTQPGLHDRMRGVAGVHQRVLNAIALMAEHAPRTRVGVCTIMLEQNLDQILPLADWAIDHPGLSHILFMAPMQPNNTPPDPRWFDQRPGLGDIFPADREKAAAVVDGLIARVDAMEAVGRKGRIANPRYQLLAMKSYFQHPDRFVRVSPCNMDRGLHVSAVGDIYLCYNHPQLGRVRDGDIETLWSGPKAAQIREEIRACRTNCHFLLNCYFEEDYPFDSR